MMTKTYSTDTPMKCKWCGLWLGTERSDGGFYLHYHPSIKDRYYSCLYMAEDLGRETNNLLAKMGEPHPEEYIITKVLNKYSNEGS